MTATTKSLSKQSTAVKVPHRWRNLATLTGVTVVDNTEGSAIATLFPTIASALGLTTAGLGTITAAGKIASVPTGPAWVWLSQRIGRRTTLIATTLSGGLFGIAAGFAQNYWQLVLFSALMSAAVIGGSPIANAVIADSFEDKDRARAAGIFYACVNGIASFIGPVIALFTGLSAGWRIGMWVLGGVCILAGAVVAIAFKDPGIGAAERELADLKEEDRVKTRVTVASVLSLFRTPTYSVMMLSRLLSGHLLITIFGVTFLVKERGFSNAVAATVLIPFGIGYIVGTLGGGLVVGWLDRVMTRRGRPLFIQFAQVAFAVVAFFATQHSHSSIGVYGVFWALMGCAQGLNVPVNRPIVTAVILPELRGQGFAIWLSIFETIGWALFAKVAGNLAATYGIREVFLWVLVGMMLLNGLVLTILYVTYPRDSERVRTILATRRNEALRSA